MKKIMLFDTTLSEAASRGMPLEFKEKVAIARNLSKLDVSSIELPAVNGSKENALLVSTVSAFVLKTVIAITAGFELQSVEETGMALANTPKRRIIIALPTSVVQMEYLCHRKPAAMLEHIKEMVAKAREYSDDVEFSALDATRADPDFLKTALTTAISAGATSVCLCDTAENMIPAEYHSFVEDIFSVCKGVHIGVKCSNKLKFSNVLSLSALLYGADFIKVSVLGEESALLDNVAEILHDKGGLYNLRFDVKITELNRRVGMINDLLFKSEKSTAFSFVDGDVKEAEINSGTDSKTLAKVIKERGYDLSHEDFLNVYEAFGRFSEKKSVTMRELDAIIAANAVQGVAVYKLRSFVINSGNIIKATANIELEKDGEVLSGICSGSGPIDAAFMAIEQIIGHHYELDDFQIQSVSEGKEAMGVAVVKLRNDGVIYSGRGASTDIIEASIGAFIIAVNKIAYKEGVR